VAALLIPSRPTLIWWRETHSLAYSRGWINLEYMVLLGIAFLFPSWWTITLLTLELCIALVEPIAFFFYFTPYDALLSVRYLLFISAHRLIGYACLLLVYIVGVAVVLRATLGDHRLRNAKRMVALALLCCLLSVVADISLGRFGGLHNGLRPGNADRRELYITRSPIISILLTPAHHMIRSVLHRVGTNNPKQPQVLRSELSQALAEIPAGSKPDVVLVLTESWGLANDDRINQAEMQPYRNSAVGDLYRIQTGSEEFIGATSAGETRELCGDSRGYFSLKDPDAYYAACWPARLKSDGYHTLSVHGFTGGMFQRQQWYKRFGFENSVFLMELKQAGATMCGGPYPGICDADVARWIGDRLLTHRDERPDFVHWVTLNSHLPVPALDDNSLLQQCSVLGIDQEQSLCSWFTLVHRVHESVASLAVRPGLRPTVFVIVGDHAPPFMRSETRNRFSQTKVPFVVLIPRFISLKPIGGTE
jgi:hypothetical protein